MFHWASCHWLSHPVMITNKVSLGFIKSPWHDHLYSITALMAWITLSVIHITRLHWLSHPVHHMYHWASCNESPCHDHKYSILLGFIQWVTLSNHMSLGFMNRVIMSWSRAFYHCAYGLNHSVRYTYHSALLTKSPCPLYVSLHGLYGLSPVYHTVQYMFVSLGFVH